jgi:hypothetical protein
LAAGTLIPIQKFCPNSLCEIILEFFCKLDLMNGESSEDEAPQAVSFNNARGKEKSLRKQAPIKKKVVKAVKKPQKAEPKPIQVPETLSGLLEEKLPEGLVNKYDKIVNMEKAHIVGPKRFALKTQGPNKIVNIDDNERVVIRSSRLQVDKKQSAIDLRFAILHRGGNNRRSMNCLK